MGRYQDVFRILIALRFEGRADDPSWMVEGMEKVPAEQFNLIGYSYGSLIAAQTAHVYASNGNIVDHLVLIGCPIDSGFLKSLQNNKNIKRLIVINLRQQKDPIYAGMSEWSLFWTKSKIESQEKESGETQGIGHFYYRTDSEEGRTRRRQLAQYLYQQGLR